MSLSNRLQKVSGADTGRLQRDPVIDALRARIHQQLIGELGPVLSDVDIEPEDLRRRVNDSLVAAIDAERAPISSADRAALLRDLADDIIGYGPLERFLGDNDVTEIMVNGPDHIYLEKKGKMERVPSGFVDEAHLRRIIDRIVAQVGRRVDEANPMVDARLPDGSRVNAVVHPLSIGGPFLTIRKFSADPYQVEDLVKFGTLSPQSVPFLDACVRGRLNVVVSGGTGTGKTTLLNVLSSFIPTDERVVTIEDAKELQLRQDHVLSMEARPSNIEGKGQVTIRDLVRNALRMRPDRIVVGECRAGEALDMLQAMNTGHDGSITTVHSNTPRDTLSRVETMTMMAGFDLPIRAIREQMASALDLIVHITRLRDGTRRVTHITEVQGMEGEIITLQDLFLFDFSAGIDADGRFLGELRSTGIRPHFSDKLADFGIHMGAEVFELPTSAATGRRRSAIGKR
ncbi:MAG TPA: CpaF family protein [Acidimicrobiales bacterium]|nr:CpaF family protein [Acidimicrobiales bacterium]